jgi:hypothetical protein
MPDVADDAAQTIELELQARISAVRKHTGQHLVPKVNERTGKIVCHNCDCEIAPGKLFCDPLPADPNKPRKTEISECQEDYENRMRRSA